ncbi:MAG: hypothetical protein OHK0029_26270 [Armatimonadaceae bacterium]
MNFPHCLMHSAFAALLLSGLSLMTTISPAQAQENPSPTTATTGAAERSDKPLVIPTPKEMQYVAGRQPFRLTRSAQFLVEEDTPGSRRAIAVLQEAIQARYGWKPKVTFPDRNKKPLIAGANPPGNTIRLVNSGGTPSPYGVVRTPDKPEGYAVEVRNDGVWVTGTDDAGILWGAQTLVQLMPRNERERKEVGIPAVEIRDYPTLAVRGVHLFHGKEALPFHKNLIERIYSPFKLNTIVIQAEQLKWESDPEVAPDWGGKKEDVRKEIAFAREHGITMIPLVQSYGHMEWMLRLPKNAQYAEDPDYGSDPEYQKDPDFIREKERRGSYGTIPFTLNYTNPDAVRYMAQFNTEADELFDAPAFHIGFDEVAHKGRGRFPYRSRPRTFADLYVSAARLWHNFFEKRGKELWMWADMALHPTEVSPSFGTAPTAEDAQKVREGLPKDIVMVDWQYGAHDQFPSLKKLKDAGFEKIIAATWFNPTNIQNLSRAAAEVGALGVLQTTWAGYESKESVLEGQHRKQFTAMVLAAEYFWNGGEGPAPDKLPYDPDEVFKQHYGK